MRISLKQNDTKPYLKVKIVDQDGGAIDVTGATIVFTMRNRADNVVKVNAAAASITSATAGEFEYRWGANDLNTVGTYEGEFQITFSDSTIMTVPGAEYIVIEVLDDLS